MLEVDPAFLKDPSSLQKIYVNSTNGTQVPLASVARFQTGNTYLSVNHQGQFPAVTLSFNLAPGVSLGEATELIRKATEELKMPSSVSGQFSGHGAGVSGVAGHHAAAAASPRWSPCTSCWACSTKA